MSIFFVVHTPYHILLSCGIGSLEANEKKYLIIIAEDIDQISKYKLIISSWDKELFSEIYILNSISNMHLVNKLKINLLINLPLNKLKMRFIFKKNAISKELKTYIFADTNVNAQYFAKICSENNGTVVYVEDGSAVYNTHRAKPIKLMCKIVYGFWYTPLEIHGTSKYVNMLMVAYPEFLRPELKRLNNIQIPDKVYDFLNYSLSPYLNEIFEINTGNLDYIIILPHFLFIKGKDEIGIINLYRIIIENLIVDHKVGLKYHPREKTNYLNIKPDLNLFLIPKSVPSEIIWMSSKKNQLKAVIGDISTALITSKKIMGCNTKVISIGKLMNLNKEYYIYLEKFGIFIPDSFEELMSYIGK